MFLDPDYDLGPEEVQRRLESLKLDSRPVSGSARLVNRHRFEGLKVNIEDAQRMMHNLEVNSKLKPLLFTRDQALATVARWTKKPEILFFHTHGFFLADRPRASGGGDMGPFGGGSASQLGSGGSEPWEDPFLRCGLVFAGCNKSPAQTGDDGYLTGAEVLAMDLHGTRLVILSACDTGVGKIRNGDGMAGLRLAFQLAGAESVVATLWSVNAKEQQALMDRFFQNLAAGQAGPEALRNAQLNASKKGTFPLYPGFWASLTFTGGSIVRESAD
jgi:CHAT domain-containing protein